MYTGRFTQREAVTSALLAAGFVLAWSSGFIGSTLGTRVADALTLLMWRFLIAAPLLLAWSLHRSRRRPARREVGLLAVVGLLSQGVYLTGTVGAVGLGVPAGTVALIAALQPILTAALAGPFLGERVRRAQWAGLVVGLAGVTLVVAGDLGAAPVAAWAYALPFASMAGLVVATVLERRLRLAATVDQSLAVQSATSAVLFTVLALGAGVPGPPASATFWLAVAWAIGLSTVGGYGLYWVNAARSGATRVSTLIYLTPPTTALWALAMFGQPITSGTIIGMGVSLAGVLMAGAPRRTGAFQASVFSNQWSANGSALNGGTSTQPVER